MTAYAERTSRAEEGEIITLETLDGLLKYQDKCGCPLIISAVNIASGRKAVDFYLEIYDTYRE